MGLHQSPTFSSVYSFLPAYIGNSCTVMHPSNDKEPSLQRVSEDNERFILDFAYREVNVYWKQMGIFLGFSKTELNAVEAYHQTRQMGPEDMAWAMLHKYWQWKGPAIASEEALRLALKEAKHMTNIPSNVQAALPTFTDNQFRILGREKEMTKMRKFFWGSQAKNYRVAPMQECKIQVISGVGGIGKSSLASCYASQHADAYSDGLFHFNVESYASLLASFKRNLSVISKAVARKEAKVHAMVSENAAVFLAFLRRCPRSLIILDNAEEIELVRDCLPNVSIPCHVLITSSLPTSQRGTSDIAHSRKEMGNCSSSCLGW
eukprot:m.278425 g.278425  ORF g.278425 m.278425 type:complete len:320 (+) comp40611_c0_seq55:48-1007(+)